MNTVSATGSPSIDGLQVLVQSLSITASRLIPNCTESQPTSVSPNYLDYSLQVCTLIASKCKSPNLHNLGLHLHFKFRSIKISKCISKFTPSGPPSGSLNILNYRLRVHLQTCLITASKCIPEFAWLSFSGAPGIAVKHRQRPVHKIPCVEW